MIMMVTTVAVGVVVANCHLTVAALLSTKRGRDANERREEIPNGDGGGGGGGLVG